MHETNGHGLLFPLILRPMSKLLTDIADLDIYADKMGSSTLYTAKPYSSSRRCLVRHVDERSWTRVGSKLDRNHLRAAWHQLNLRRKHSCLPVNIRTGSVLVTLGLNARLASS